MKLNIELNDKFVTVGLNEEKLTTTLAPDLKSEFLFLNQKGHKNILLNLETIKFVDSSGLSALLRANSICREAGGIFVIFNVTEHVMKTISISQLHNVLNIVTNEQEARQAVFMHEIESEIQDEIGGEIKDEFEDLGTFNESGSQEDGGF